MRLVGLPTPEVRLAPDVLIIGQTPSTWRPTTQPAVAIAPLRFGAGVKGKVLEAMGYGLPVVMTPVAAEGIHARPGADALIAATACQLRHRIVTPITDDALWRRPGAQWASLGQGVFHLIGKCLSEFLDMATRTT